MIFAVQRLATRRKIRSEPINIILFFSGPKPMIEEMSEATRKQIKTYKQSSAFTKEERQMFNRHIRGKVKKKKNPNPLSCLKKKQRKRKLEAPKSREDAAPKRKRRRKKRRKEQSIDNPPAEK